MASEDNLLHSAISEVLAIANHSAAAVEETSDCREYPLQIVPPVEPCRRIVYTTKIDWLILLADGFAKVPKDIAILWRFGPLREEHRQVVRSLILTFNAPLVFVGDLDPLDLVTYATLLGAAESPALLISYLGIADSWLKRCELDLKLQTGRSLELACIQMGAEERDGFERLKNIGVDWVNLLGTRAVALLDSGLKLELEGASSPRFYSSSFQDELLRFVFQ